MTGYCRFAALWLAASAFSLLAPAIALAAEAEPAEGDSVSVMLPDSARPVDADTVVEGADAAPAEDSALIELPVNDFPSGADHPVYRLRPEPFSEGGAITLSLDEVMGLVLEHNAGLQVQGLGIERDHYTVDQTYYAFDHDYAARLNYSRRNVGGVGAAQQGGLSSSEVLSADFDYSIPREYGDDFTINYGVSRSSLSFAGDGAGEEFPTTYSADITLGYNRPLARGAGRYFNRIPRFVASNNLLLAYDQLDEETRQVKRSVLDTYFRAVTAREVIRVREESLEVALQQLERAVERYKVGLAIRADVLQAENSVLVQRSALLAAQKDYSDLLDTLTTLTGLPQEIDIAVDPDGALIELGSVLPSDLWELVECNSFELKSLTTQLANLRLAREQAAEQLEPNVGLSMSYSRSGEDESLTSTLGGYENESYSIGLNWSGIRGERNAKAEVAKATLDIASIDLEIEQAELELKAALRTLQRDLETKLNQLVLARSNLEVVRETYNIVVERHNVGLATMLDVVEAQEDVLAAELAVLQAQVAYQETYRQIQLLAGLL